MSDEESLWAAKVAPDLLAERDQLAARVAELEGLEADHLALMLDVNRLLSGDFRAAHAANQWMCDKNRAIHELRARVAELEGENERLKRQVAKLEDDPPQWRPIDQM